MKRLCVVVVGIALGTWPLVQSGCGREVRPVSGVSGGGDSVVPIALADAEALGFPIDGSSLAELERVEVFQDLSFERPVFVTYAPDDRGRLFVVEQGGRIQVFDPQSATRSDTFLDISDRVRTAHNEEGLLGLAFHPDFARNGQFFVFYSASNPRRSQVSRFTVNGNGNGDPSSEAPVLSVDQPYGNHNGGTVLFGPDGALYAGFGDGGAANDPVRSGQDLSTLLGKIVRVRVRENASGYTIPTDNPFVNESGARAEIWAYGLRNPWRFSFDRQTGQMWAADVGQNLFEEVDQVVAGGNYGWSAREGNHDFVPERARPGAELLPPIIEYGRDLGESITGGYVYRGTALAGFRGAYFYGDYVSGRVWALKFDGNTVVSNTEVAHVPSLSSFGEDANGELFAVGLGGRIFRFDTLPDGDSGGEREDVFPRFLSETTLFSDLVTLTPSVSLIPYEVNVEFWSDGAEKQRWLALPENGKVGFSADGAWTFPVGSLLVKHFELEGLVAKRLETRVMVHERAGWAGYTYRWNDAQTDAELVGSRVRAVVQVERVSGTHTQTWEFPAGSDCLRCHTDTHGAPLGLRTRQLNREVDGENQIDRWNAGGLFSESLLPAISYPSHPGLGDQSVAIETRARAYLDVNCAVCHHRGGPAPGSVDMRAEVGLEDMNVVSVVPEEGLGIGDEERIAPGDHARSSVWARITRRDEAGMPPLSSLAIDEAGAELVAAWIDSLVE